MRFVYLIIPFHEEYGYEPADSNAFDSEESAKAYSELCAKEDENGWTYEVITVMKRWGRMLGLERFVEYMDNNNKRDYEEKDYTHYKD